MEPVQKKYNLIGKLPTFSPHVQRLRATQLLLDREVEFRLLPERATEDWRTLFLLELEDLLNLDHPAFSSVIDHGKTRDRPFYVVPLRHHSNLWNLVKNEAIDPAEACRVSRALAEAMAAGHRADLTLGPPSPLTLCWDPEGRRLSFMHHRFARDVRTLPLVEHLPEDARLAEQWDHRSDVFHWAYLTYWLVSGGELPYKGPGPAAPVRCVRPDLARDLSHIIDACLSRDPQKRPDHTLELSQLLRQQPADLVDGDPLELSGTIPMEALAGQLEQLRASESSTPLQPPPGRVTLELKSVDVDLSALPHESSALGRSIGIFLALLLILGGAGGLALRGVKKRVTGYRVRTNQPVRRPSPPPQEPEPEPPAYLAPSTQAKFRKFSGVARILKVREVHPARFPGIWRQVRNLALKGKLPADAADGARIKQLRETYKGDRAAGCAAMQVFLSELRSSLGETDDADGADGAG